MHAHWILDHLERDEGGRWTSTFAANRYRGLIPAQSLSRAGDRISVHMMGDWIRGATGAHPRPDVVVVGKLFIEPEAERQQRKSDDVLRRIRAERERGVHVLVDVCDDHFQHRLIGEHWRTVVQAADVCTAGSTTLAAVVARYTDVPVHVVEDPIASQRREPRVFRQARPATWRRFGLGSAPAPLRVCWYGHTDNWPAMQTWIDVLAQCTELPRLLVRIVTKPHDRIQRFVRESNAQRGATLRIEYIPWDEETQWAVVAESDVVLLPSDPADPRKAAKSHNRLVDALHAGCFVIASPIGAYQAFADHVCLTDDPVAGLLAYLSDPDGSLARIAAGQALVTDRCGADAIARQWLRAMEQHVPAQDRPPIASARGNLGTGVVRLNLGCGDKILEGYVNVDVVASRRGCEPDVLCDLHDLSVFPDDHADEVMAIHVVEHFWRWEIETILREWVRVLKPGGRMIVECPNLIAACEEFLRDPQRHAGAGQEGQRTMWVFYGDPAWRDPYMIHRWGYTPASLQALMESAGLAQVRQEPAQFKLREPRDMRVVGIKPGAS